MEQKIKLIENSCIGIKCILNIEVKPICVFILMLQEKYKEFCQKSNSFFDPSVFQFLDNLEETKNNINECSKRFHDCIIISNQGDEISCKTSRICSASSVINDMYFSSPLVTDLMEMPKPFKFTLSEDTETIQFLVDVTHYTIPDLNKIPMYKLANYVKILDKYNIPDINFKIYETIYFQTIQLEKILITSQKKEGEINIKNDIIKNTDIEEMIIVIDTLLSMGCSQEYMNKLKNLFNLTINSIMLNKICVHNFNYLLQVYEISINRNCDYLKNIIYEYVLKYLKYIQDNKSDISDINKLNIPVNFVLDLTTYTNKKVKFCEIKSAYNLAQYLANGCYKKSRDLNSVVIYSDESLNNFGKVNDSYTEGDKKIIYFKTLRHNSVNSNKLTKVLTKLEYLIEKTITELDPYADNEPNNYSINYGKLNESFKNDDIINEQPWLNSDN